MEEESLLKGVSIVQCDIDKCPLNKTIEAVDKKAEQNAEDIKNLSNKVGSFLISYGKIETLIEKIVIPKLDELDTVIQDLVSRPGKRWDLVMSTLITALVSGGGMYLITHLTK